MVTAFVNQMNKDFEKKYGKQVVFEGKDKRFKIKRIPTGILSLDLLMGGGVPIGRWCEIYGDESLLKTSIAMMAIAEAQRMGYAALYCNIERNVTNELFELRGVDLSPDKLTIVQTDIAEDYVDIIKQAMQQEIYKVIVIDSIAAMFPKREHDTKADSAVGAQGLLTSKMGRVLTASNDNSTALILVNQTREKIGISFGDSTTRPGGRAPRFYDSMTIRLTRIGTDREGTSTEKKGRGYRKVTGLQIAAELEKTKAGGIMGNETVIYYDTQNNKVDDAQEIISMGRVHGIITKVGRQLQIGSTKMFEKNLKAKLRSNKKFARNMKRLIIEQVVGEDDD